MAGRKRKIIFLEETEAPGKGVNKRDTKTNLNTSHPQLKSSFCCENDKSTGTERSCYFTENNLQSRLGDDFFNQPCISLAKAMLGKVRLY